MITQVLKLISFLRGQFQPVCILISVILLISSTRAIAQPSVKQEKWKLVWEDNFNSNTSLDRDWEFQHSPSKSLLSSRWRENAKVADGLLIMDNRMENRGGQGFTSASLWTRKVFRYGYYECRYKYAAATGTNNSFWIMPRGDSIKFEIDINEGRYPNEITTNTHRNYPLPKFANSRSLRPGVTIVPELRIDLKAPLTTDRIRLISVNARVSVREVKLFAGQRNVAIGAKASSSADLRQEFGASNAIDGNADSRWVSPDGSPDTLTITLPEATGLNAIEISSGYRAADGFRSTLYQYSLQYFVNGSWQNLPTEAPQVPIDLAKDFHTYGLLWSENELIWFFDGKEIRREKNTFCHGFAHVWLSSAIATWAGPVTREIDGTAMKVDYVRIYEKEN